MTEATDTSAADQISDAQSALTSQSRQNSVRRPDPETRDKEREKENERRAKVSLHVRLSNVRLYSVHTCPPMNCSAGTPLISMSNSGASILFSVLKPASVSSISIARR